MAIWKNRCPCCHGVVRTKKHRKGVIKVRKQSRTINVYFIENDSDCVICGRNIRKVGISKRNNRFCSPACSGVANRMKQRGITHTTVKVAIKDLPRLFRRNKGLTIGR